MERKIKTLYTLSIIAILTFLGMQIYWLYARYEYSLREHEDKLNTSVEKVLDEYFRIRNTPAVQYNQFAGRVRSSYNMNNDTDSTGKQIRTVTVSTEMFNGRALLGITEDRKLTQEEQERLGKIVLDSLDRIDQMKDSFDASSAPSDGAAWTAMKNFELEIHAPFTTEGVDSLLVKENVEADVRLEVLDSMIWKPIKVRHTSILNPRFKVISSYSELERKAVVVDCKIPTSAVVKEMGWTLAMAFVLSVFLILCLIWQIKTIVKLTKLDKMRNMFITTMIHELKRPISTLKMCVSGIENEKMLADKEIKAELMTGTRTALDNLSAYFSKLRDITFNNVEQIPLNVTKFNLSRLVNDVFSSISIPCGKSVRFDNGIDADIEVSADRSHIFNIVNNLVENAIKYSGENVEIRVGVKQNDTGVTLNVSDTGNGIAESDLDKVFTRFYRGKSTINDIPGMGLGLTYVKLLVEAHGGTISVNSKAGAGTSFTINLPQ
ncbi:MAG: HAMP domain-containing histidine kinase [Staphylococcus sp.]|nr:HAMP domain-containing histidine kinase [Staphylococcus sp.]